MPQYIKLNPDGTCEKATEDEFKSAGTVFDAHPVGRRASIAIKTDQSKTIHELEIHADPDGNLLLKLAK